MDGTQSTARIFDVEVTHYPEDGVWVGICDDLPFATEGDSYEALVNRAWLVAPEMAVENKVAPADGFDLRFIHRSAAIAAE